MTGLNELKKHLVNAGCDFSENEPMDAHTSFKIGGPADLFLRPVNREMLKDAYLKCLEYEVPVNIIGSGTNLLVSDFGVVGAVIYTGGMSDISVADSGIIEVCAGAKISRVCSAALENSLAGLEFAWGIPGTVGGAVYMNAGAYGGEMKNITSDCTFIDKNGEFCTADIDSMKLGYRTSVFQKNEGIIISAVLKLKIDDPVQIRERMDELISRRKQKQPLDMPSAGSTFKRPEGNYAGTLIEQSGLKGFSVGGAQVSEKHAGFVVNTGGATCDDVLRLIDIIKNKVYEDSSVELECEVRVLK